MSNNVKETYLHKSYMNSNCAIYMYRKKKSQLIIKNECLIEDIHANNILEYKLLCFSTSLLHT